MSDQYRSSSKTPFKWHFAGRQTLSRFFMFSFEVSFDIMHKSTIIFSDTHFWCLKESSRWDGSFEHQNLTLKVIENTILHTTCPSVHSLVRTITLKENRIIKKKSIWSIMFFTLLPEKSILPAHPWANMAGRRNKKHFYICSEVIDSITDANSRC